MITDIEKVLDEMIDSFKVKNCPLIFSMNKTTGKNLGDSYKGIPVRRVNDWVLEDDYIILGENVTL